MKKQNTKPVTDTPVDRLMSEYPRVYKLSNQRSMLLISSLLLMLGLLGICWAVPFPHIKILGSYNGFINWASFFIAIAGYFYYRLSPGMCYVIILIMFALTYLVTCLQNWQHIGGPSMPVICGVLTGASALIFLMSNKRVLDKIGFGRALNLWALTPVWFLYKMIKKQ